MYNFDTLGKLSYGGSFINPKLNWACTLLMTHQQKCHSKRKRLTYMRVVVIEGQAVAATGGYTALLCWCANQFCYQVELSVSRN